MPASVGVEFEKKPRGVVALLKLLDSLKSDSLVVSVKLDKRDLKREPQW